MAKLFKQMVKWKKWPPSLAGIANASTLNISMKEGSSYAMSTQSIMISSEYVVSQVAMNCFVTKKPLMNMWGMENLKSYPIFSLQRKRRRERIHAKKEVLIKLFYEVISRVQCINSPIKLRDLSILDTEKSVKLDLSGSPPFLLHPACEGEKEISGRNKFTENGRLDEVRNPVMCKKSEERALNAKKWSPFRVATKPSAAKKLPSDYSVLSYLEVISLEPRMKIYVWGSVVKSRLLGKSLTTYTDGDILGKTVALILSCPQLGWEQVNCGTFLYCHGRLTEAENG